MVQSYTKPVLTKFYHIAPLMVQRYERYLPTAFDESLTMLEKINKMIHHINQYDEGQIEIAEKVNELLEQIDRHEQLLQGAPNIVVSKTEPSIIDNDIQNFWYKEV